MLLDESLDRSELAAISAVPIECLKSLLRHEVF